MKQEAEVTVEAMGVDYRRPMKRAAVSQLKADDAGYAKVLCQCEQCGGTWDEIMSVGPAEQAGQYYDLFTQHICRN